jgi:hypothetical protein
LRKLTPLALVSLLLLAGCSQAPVAEHGSYAAMSAGSVAACDAYKGGEAVDQIKVEGAFGEEPTATFPTPLGCTVTGLTNGTEVTFTARANNGAYTSDTSTASSVVTPSARRSATAGNFFFLSIRI